ncbi:hypothetical protein V1520DRAFT_341571 [Lipomyces starkeyi]|uniref:Leucine-rich repeat-containing protein n=1 Tax=Lipomyces starkeyi NRRL Y-11557 TaxID=675824 RepID=A0A1E3Q3A1_LIPST|nr:hypothetical protein LIPSTDRAFT_327709 [Lipomyces starkeyi NRRL Y-11557]
MPDKLDGDTYVRNLAAFIRANERQLANTRRPNGKDNAISILPSSFQSRTKPARLSLTPHHLFYLLHRFKELGLSVGPLSMRLESIQADGYPTNYVSFLNGAYQNHIENTSDTKSIQSEASVRSTLSGVSAIFSIMSFSSMEKAKVGVENDLKYIYSAFTKVPALRLAVDRKAKVIDGFEEFPFDRAVPMIAFKNISSLELLDIDVRVFYGWHTVSERLRSLSVKRGQLDDPVELIVALVLDDIDRRRNRTSTPVPVYANATSDGGDLQGSPRELPNLLLTRVTSRSSRASRRRESVSRSPARVQSLSGSSAQMSRRRSDSISSVVSTSSSYDSSASPPTSLGPMNWQFLRHLTLSDCGISSISNESMLPLGNSLISLDLSFNLLISIPEALSYLSRLASLNVSFNLISSLHSLTHHPLPAITVLNMRGNKLVSLAGLDRIASLERLDLRDNKLADPTELARLTGAPNISEVWVLGNPFVKTHTSSYRITIFNLFRQTPGYTNDILLDGSLPGLLEQMGLAERVEESVPSPITTRYPSSPGTNTDKAEKGSRIKLDVDNDLLPVFKGFNFFGKSSPVQRQDDKPEQTAKVNGSVIRGSDNIRDDTLTSLTAIRTPAIKVINPSPRQTKKKLGRRRIVDLDLPDSGDDQMSTKTSGSAVSSSKYSPTSFSPPLSPSENDWTRQGEEYRKRVEALRNDFGSGWLSVLSEEL